MKEPVHIVVIGGGISGLSAAWAMTRNDLARPPAARALQTKVTVLEAGPRLGGKIHTTEFAGCPVDTGPDAFLARVPWATHLCHELGMSKDLVSPSRSSAFVWTRNKLRGFPRRQMLGVPAGPTDLITSGLVSKAGALRAGADFTLPYAVGRGAQYPTVGHLVGTRLGREVLDRVVDPLIGGINAGRCDDLDLEACAPNLADIAVANSSLMRGVAAHLRSAPSPKGSRAAFRAPVGGMTTLVNTLDARLVEAGASIRTGISVLDIFPQDGKWSVVVSNGDRLTADGVLIATPAQVAADLLNGPSPKAASIMRGIRHASVAMVRLAYESAAITTSIDGSGFVVPAVDGRLVTACSWSSSKWSHLARKGRVVMRASVGRIDDRRFTNMSDEELIAAVHDELSGVMKIMRSPVAADVTRWMDAFPQYEPGHITRMLNVERAVAEVPGLAVAGAALRGLGIPACIRSGREAGEELIARLSEPARPRSVARRT